MTEVIKSKLYQPTSFIFYERWHDVSGWKNLLHDFMEDIFSVSEDKGAVLKDKSLGTTDKIFCSVSRIPYSRRLSNGCYMPMQHNERDYAIACREICSLYAISPLDFRIIYKEDLEDLKYSLFTETQWSEDNHPEDKETNDSKEEAEDQAPQQRSDKEIKVDKPNIQDTVKKIYEKRSGTGKKSESHSDKTETDKKEEKTGQIDTEWNLESNPVLHRGMYDPEGIDWEKIQEYFLQKNDIRANSVIKKLKKQNIPLPTSVDVTFVTKPTFENNDLFWLRDMYIGRITSCAMLLWDKENIVYFDEKLSSDGLEFPLPGYRWTSNVNRLAELMEEGKHA